MRSSQYSNFILVCNMDSEGLKFALNVKIYPAEQIVAWGSVVVKALRY
jgi:hypothetical protein